MDRLARARIGRAIARLLFWPAVLYVMFRWFEHQQVFQPSKEMEASGADLGRPWKDVFFRAADGTELNGWFFPADSQSPSGTKHRVVLLCHGNAGNISHRLATSQALLDLGVGVFVFDYRGYGRSLGRPSETGTYHDAEAAYDWLRREGVGSEQIIVFGESLGGAVASELALRRPIGGLILLSTFTSVPAIGLELFPWLPVKLLGTIQYNTASKLPRINAPLLIMHSKSDSLIGFHHGQTLFEAAHEPKIFWEVTGDHNDTLRAGLGRCQEGLKRFFDSL